jgi:alpha-glucoside transport system substrate-binding protein
VGGIALGQVNPDLKVGEDIDFFPFPQINPDHGDPLVGAGDVASGMVNNEDVARLIEYLATPEAGRIWVSTGAIVSPNRGVADDAYPNPLVRKEADQVKNAESFRFDGSDLLPGTLGQDFGTLLQKIVKTPNQMNALLDDYQAAAEKAFAAQ